MEERTIEVTVISASDLKNVKTFGGHQSSYVVAYIFPDQKRSTKVDNKGGLNPVWNSKLTFTCDDRLLERGGFYLALEIFSHGTLSDKLIGTVSIPLHVPVSSDGKEAKIGGSPVEYSVRRPSGKAKGFLKVSVKLGEKRIIQKYAGMQQGYAYSQDYKKQSKPAYPPATYGSSASAGAYYPGAFVNSVSVGVVYPPQVSASTSNADAISPYSSSFSAAAYPPPSTRNDPPPPVTGYPTSGTTGANAAVPAYPDSFNPPSSVASSSSSSSSEPVTAFPAMGYPVQNAYPMPQYAQQYPGPQYYSQQAAYYPPQPQPYYSKPPKRHSSGPGFGTGLLGGALGGLLLGDMLDFDC